MALADQGYRTSRLNDFGGGINMRNSSDSIDNNQWVYGNNMSSEANKLITLPGYVDVIEVGSGITQGQAIEIAGTYILVVHNRHLYIYDTATGSTFTKTNAVADSTSTYQIVTTKSFASGKLSIVLINTLRSVTEDIVAYEFDGAVFTTPTFTSLSNKNFKCGKFHEGKLWLGGNPAYPSSLYTSRTGSALNPSYIYDFSAYDSTSQSIGDDAPIVNIMTNNSTLFVVKNNSIWNRVGTQDTGTAVAYQFSQVSASGSLNTHTVLNVEQDTIYFDGTSFRRVSYEANLSALQDDNISKDILPIIDSLPDDQINNATMYYAYPYVKLALRDKFSDSNSVIIIYNVIDKSYSTQTGLDITQGVGGFVDSKRVSYFIGSQTSTIYKDNVGTSYNGGNIMFNQLGKRFVLGDGVDYKRISQVEIYGQITPGLATMVDIYVNGVQIDTRTIYLEDILLPTTGSANLGNSLIGANNEEETPLMRDYVARYEYFNDGRDYQLGFRGNGQGRFELHGMNVMYKAIKAYDLHS